MDHQNDNLWRGGPWEQPAPSFTPPPAVVLPKGAMQPPVPVLRPRRRRRMWPAFAGLSALILVLVLIAAVINHEQNRLPHRWPTVPEDDHGAQTQEYSTEPPSIAQAETGTGVTVDLVPDHATPLTYDQIYAKNAPSIVSIEAEHPTEYNNGSGVVLTEDGYIITNAHVVAGASRVRVAFFDNTVLPASLVGFDAEEDLAVLKVDAQGLIPAEFGDSAALRCGDPVATIGDPLGYRSTITDGIVSALEREVSIDNITMVLIQTSAAINYGSSGGALINQYGQVVGITTIKIVSEDGSAEGLGFAIPSQRVKYVADTLIAGGEVHTGVFGFTVLRRPAPGGGMILDSVHPNSDAYAKGLQKGDVILTANGLPVTSIQDLSRVKLPLGPGDPVTLAYLREGQTYTVDVALVDADTING